MAINEREVVTLRIPKSLVRKLDERMRRRQRELGTTKWSRNDELMAMLESVLKNDADAAS